MRNCSATRVACQRNECECRAHKHPSGDPTPSREDIEITRRLREVGEIMGGRGRVLDHIIFGKGRYCSMIDDGYSVQ
ncbi:MAG: hypothetical protein HY270_06030 [Deltaproteobacteria bacterium]|nr:hypothetical protein [Deltaproteobacteria bacterium]